MAGFLPHLQACLAQAPYDYLADLANSKTVTVQPSVGDDKAVVRSTTKTKKQNTPAKLQHKNVMRKEFRKMVKAIKTRARGESRPGRYHRRHPFPAAVDGPCTHPRLHRPLSTPAHLLFWMIMGSRELATWES